MLTVFTRHFFRAAALLCVSLLALNVYAPAALAAPAGDTEGGSASLRDVLDSTTAAYNDAKGRLDVSVQRQSELNDQIKTTELRLADLGARTGTIAAAAYRGSKVSMIGAVMDSGSPDALLDAVTTARYMVARDNKQLRDLTTARKTLADQQSALNDQIKLQQVELTTMEQKKNAAANALKAAGGGQVSAGVIPGQATASQAPRNADGSWPKETCSIDDPTTTGCITPRMLHAYQEVRIAGFTHYTACFRQESSGEHPKGRACDFSANATTFVNARATGADKAYGDKLAGWLIANTSRLGVLYVIWYKQIWLPGQGWRSYTGDGTPAGDHYNHVHLSVQ